MKELQSIQTELRAPKNQHNKFGGYAYRSAEDILEAVKPLLAKYGCTLTLSDEVSEIGSRFYIMAKATLTNSEDKQVTVTAFAREAAEKKGMDEAQITGSASSYARKYALNGLLAIDDNKDADELDKIDEAVNTDQLVAMVKEAEQRNGGVVSDKVKAAARKKYNELKQVNG